MSSMVGLRVCSCITSEERNPTEHPHAFERKDAFPEAAAQLPLHPWLPGLSTVITLSVVA